MKISKDTWKMIANIIISILTALTTSIGANTLM